MLLFYTVINDIFQFDVRIFVLITYCFIDNTTVLCLVLLFLHSHNVIVCHVTLVCNNLILFCNIQMLVFTNYNTVMCLLLSYVVVLLIIIMFYCFCYVGLHSYTVVLCLVMRVCNFLILLCTDMFSLLK